MKATKTGSDAEAWVAKYVVEALGAIGTVADRWATADDAEKFRFGLEAVLAELAERGWEVAPGGKIIEAWRKRAAKGWIPGHHAHPGITDGSAGLVRVVEGVRCQVYAEDFGDGPRWNAIVGDEAAADLPTEAAAKVYAVSRARALAEVSQSATSRANSRTASRTVTASV